MHTIAFSKVNTLSSFGFRLVERGRIEHELRRSFQTTGMYVRGWRDVNIPIEDDKGTVLGYLPTVM